MRADQTISAMHLDDQLARGAEISKCIGAPNLEALPYILDIDLDVFHMRKAITPEDTSTFYRLIKNAEAITVATEPKCVEELWVEEEDPMTADDLLQALLAHIKSAI